MESSLPEAVARRLFGDNTPSHEGYLEALDELQARWDTIERAQFESWAQVATGSDGSYMVRRSVGRHWWVKGMGSAALIEGTFNGQDFVTETLRVSSTYCRRGHNMDAFSPAATTEPTRKVRRPHELTFLDRTLYENNRLQRGAAIRGEKRIVLVWELTPEELTDERERMRRISRKYQKKDWGANAPKLNRYNVATQSFDIATGQPVTETQFVGYDEKPNLIWWADYMAVDWDEAGYRAALGDE